MIYGRELERIRKELYEKKQSLIKELDSLPEGELLCTTEKGTVRYYQRLPAKGNRKKERRYGIKGRPDMMNHLVRKAYAEKALRIIDRDLRVIDTACQKYMPVDELSVLESLLRKHPELKERIYRIPIEIDGWKSTVERIDDYHPENLRQIAADGTRMRSKSELYIASRLDHFSVVYRSDCPTGIPGLKWVPDYTILRMRDLKTLYWEHLGMMDNPDYRSRNRVKFADYERAGIVPWDNLIITYDLTGGILQADLVDALIKSWIL